MVFNIYKLTFILLAITAITLQTANNNVWANSVKTIGDGSVASERCNQFTFDATGSYDADTEDLNYFWDFGDGNTSSDPVVTHTYEKSGKYLVELKITDNQGLECSTGITSQTVHVNIPPYAYFHSDKATCTDREVVFDASASYDTHDNILSYEWNFGDGTSAGNKKKVTKTYTKGGEYTVTLVVDDQDSNVCNINNFTKTIHVNEPPIADAGVEEILRCVEDADDYEIFFDASRSSDINNDPLTYTWDFGNSRRGSGEKIKHVYTETGNYDVKLIVNDPTNLGCGTGIDFVNVKLNKRPKANAGKDVVACINEIIHFDGSQSFMERAETTNAMWYFGDGQKEGVLKTKHGYSKAGRYEAKLVLTNALNEKCAPSSDKKTIYINSVPTVEIKAKESGCLDDTFTFDASSAHDPDGDALEYYWSFGDGSAKKGGAIVSHRYKKGGKYTVTLVVDDGKGSKCSSTTTETEILVNTQPIADAGLNLTCCVDQSSVFDASASTDADGDELTYTWDFGNGRKRSGAVVNYTYSKDGVYDVSVTVDDNSGTECSSSTAGFKAQVNSSPVPVIKIH